MAEVTRQLVDQFAGKLEAMMQEHQNRAYAASPVLVSVQIMEGKRYFRIVRHETMNGKCVSRSAHCFIDRTNGNVYKPAGWKGPTKNFPRGNILDDTGGMGWMGVYGVASGRRGG